MFVLYRPGVSVAGLLRRSTRGRRPGRTPGQPYRCPGAPSPPRAAWWQSASCTPARSGPTVHLVSEENGPQMRGGSLSPVCQIRWFCCDSPSSHPRGRCSGAGGCPALSAPGRLSLGGSGLSSGRPSRLCGPHCSCSGR